MIIRKPLFEMVFPVEKRTYLIIRKPPFVKLHNFRHVITAERTVNKEGLKQKQVMPRMKTEARAIDHIKRQRTADTILPRG